MLRIWRSMFWCLLEILAYPYINEVSSDVYDKKLTFILYNNRSDNERYKCMKKTVVYYIHFITLEDHMVLFGNKLNIT